MFVVGISVGDASCPTSTQLPERLAPVDGFCRAPALLAGLSSKACRASLKEKDRVNFEMCLCEALGVGLEASQSRLTFTCSGVPLPSST
ncbi:hypothetical protein ACFXTN_012433 [Malus domestica]